MKTVSVVMAVYNSKRTLRQALISLEDQDYQGGVELIVADGGSTDGSLEILEEFGAKIISERSGSPEKAKALALQKARGELVLFMASDNILPDKGWLSQMIGMMKKEPGVVGVYPWRYGYRKKDTSLNRYFALIGVNDLVAWWLGRADRQSYGGNEWNLAGRAEDKGDYFLVEFGIDKMPTLGDNGFLVKRKELMKAKVGVKDFFHIDVCHDLIELGQNKFGVVKTTIIHDTGEKYFKFLKKRFRYMRELYLRELNKRRFVLVKNWEDRLRILGFIVYTLTLAGPLYTAFRGFLVKRDLAWFWHPVMCWSMVFIYGVAVLIR